MISIILSHGEPSLLSFACLNISLIEKRYKTDGKISI